jgi:RNA polymerase primary sigma factor
VQGITNEQLIALIQAGEDTAANMERLWTQNRAFVAKLALKYQAYAEFDDLMQEGYLGLCQAVDGYDPEAGSSFLHYAAYWIKRAMLFYIRSNGTVRIPVNLHSQISQYERFRSSFLSEYGREPDHREISYYLGISRKSVPGLKKAARMRQIGSLDSPVEGTEGLTLEDCIPGHEEVEEDALEAVQQEQLKAVLWPMVDELPGKCGEVLRGRYQDNKTLKELSEELDCSYQMVATLQNNGLREMRKPSRSRRLSPFVRDYIDIHGYRGSAASFQRTWTSSTEYTALGLAERG